MRDQNIRNKFKDGPVGIYHSVRDFEKWINCWWRGKAEDQAFTRIRDELRAIGCPGVDHQSRESFIDALRHVAGYTGADPSRSAWALTAQKYLEKIDT